MALKDLLEYNESKQVREAVDRERIRQDKKQLEELISFWRCYPDIFVDYLCSLNPDNTFHFFYYQRVYLRAVMRYKYTFCTFPRAFSKSFLAVLCLMIKCILYPGCRIFTVAGGKEQSASILQAKVDELCRLIPALANEIIWDTRTNNKTSIIKAKTRTTRDSVIYTFKNGSSLENVAASEKTRGQRFQAGLMEEVVGIDQDILNEVILPLMNVERRVNGFVDPNEPLNQSQIYITTAGYKNTFSYDKLIQILCQSAVNPDKAIILGGSWRIPVMEGLLNRNFVADLRMDGTFNEASFEREYESLWAGAVEGAFFDPDRIDKRRTLQLPEKEPNKRNNPSTYYALGVDVGRHGCTSEVIVIKVAPARTGVPLKEIVNLYSFDEEHFGLQAIKIKRIYQQYHCKIAVIDANGLGTGLVDFLITDQTDPDTGEFLPNLGVYNDDEGKYKKFETEDTIPKAMYLMKANAPLNTEMYAYCQSQLNAGKIRFLIDENVAKNKLAGQAQSKRMTAGERAAYLQPYVMTSILREQMLNLIEETENLNIILKQATRKIKKDKFSALIYGLYWCKLEEDKGARRKKRDLSKLMLFS